MSAMQAGTVCYVVGVAAAPELIGRVVTLTGRTRLGRWRMEYEFLPYLKVGRRTFGYGSRESLLPISGRDQPATTTRDRTVTA